MILDARGRVFISWDTYDKGDYDVLLRVSEGGELGNSIAVADSLRFEARVSLAVDRRDRLWIAYQEGGPNWGKDFGTGVYEGNPLYSTGLSQSRMSKVLRIGLTVSIPSASNVLTAN